jgi:hypothetical protein
MDKVFLGILPDGSWVHVTPHFIAEFGMEEARYEFVDKVWIRETGSAPGYHRIRTHPFNDDYVLVKAPSFQEALELYLNRKKI